MLFTTLALPFAIITVIGIVLGGNPGRLAIGLSAHSKDSLARRLAAALDATPAFHVTTFGSDQSLVRAVRTGQIDAGVIVPTGYGPALLAGKTTDLQLVTTPATGAATARAVLGTVVSAQVGAVQAGTFSSSHTHRPVGAEIARAQRAGRTLPAPAVRSESVAGAGTVRLGVDYTAPSNLTLFVILTSMTSSAALVETRRTGVARRMYSMPLARCTVLLGEFLGRLLTAGVQAAVIIVFCAVSFGTRWGDPPAVAALTLVLCVFGASLGMLVGFAARTVTQTIAFGPPAGIALGMLGGCMWPLTIVGTAMRVAGHVTPNAWIMDGYVTLINTGGGVSSVLRPLAVVAGMSAFLLAATTGVVRTRSFA